MSIGPEELKWAVLHCYLMGLLHDVRPSVVYGQRKRYHTSPTFVCPFDRIVAIHIEGGFAPLLGERVGKGLGSVV
jgi:hypothetical protein